MAYEMYDLKGILFLVFAIPMIASTNIDCSGRAFHCVNSTHFMICVDLGGGISTTIDDFIIPCPPTTVCHEYNIFECEFPKTLVTIPPLQVIGVSKPSDLSVMNSVIHNVTVPTPPDKTLIVLNENTTVTTVPKQEEVISVNKLEVLEIFKQPKENSTDTSANSDTVIVEQTDNNRNKKTSAIDKSIILDLAVQTSTDKAVNTSDKSKSIDTASTGNYSYKNSTNEVNVLITKRSMETADINKNVEDKTNTFIWNGKDSMSHNSTERNSMGEISTPEKVVHVKNSFMLERAEDLVVDQKTTPNNFELLGFADNVSTPTTISDNTFLDNTSQDTNAMTEQYTTTQMIINRENIKNVSGIESDVLSEISTTTVANTNFQNINKNNVNNQNELVYQNFIEQIPKAEVTGAEPGKITKYIYPDNIEISVTAPETVVTSPQTTRDRILENIINSTTVTYNNDSFVEDVTDGHPIEITITTDLTIKMTNDSYKMNRELSKAFISTNNKESGSNDTIATIHSMYNTSSTNMFYDITTELTTFLTATYPTTETSTSQNEVVASGKDVENEISTTITPSVNIPLNVYTTPVPYNATFYLVENNTVKDWISQIEINPDALPYTVDVLEPKTSENLTFLDSFTTTENTIMSDQAFQNLSPTPTTPSLYPNELTTNMPETVNTTTISMDYVSKVTKHNPVITDKSLSTMDLKVETSTTVPLDITHYNIGGKEKFENILITTMPGWDAVTQDVHKQISINSVSTKRFADIFSTVSTIYAEDYNFTSNSKDSEYIETTISTVGQNKTDDKSGTITSMNVKSLDETTSLPPPTNTYKDESVKIMSMMEITTSSINSQLNQQSTSDTNEMLNLTKNNATNTSLSDGIGTIKENSILYPFFAYNILGNKFTDVAESASEKNTQTTESLPQKNNTNLELSITDTQTSLIKDKKTENGENVTSINSPLRTVGFNQRDPTTNSINYVTEQNVNFASSYEVIVTKQSNLSNVETKAANPVSNPALDTITKTTDFAQSTTHIFHPQSFKNKFEERKELPVIETQINNYDSIKPLLPVLQPAPKKYTIIPVTSAPLAMIYSDTSKIKMSDLPLFPMPTANYNITTEAVTSYVTASSSMMNNSKGIEKIIIEANNDVNVSLSEDIFNNQPIIDLNLDDKSVNNAIDHEKFLMENNTFQMNLPNITNSLKQLVDINKENLNYTENNWIPSDVNIETVQKTPNDINGSPLVDGVTSESTVSKSTDIQNKTLPTDLELPTQIDNKDLKQPDLVKYMTVITSSLDVTKTGSTAPKSLPQSKTLEAYTEVPYKIQNAFRTDSQNISFKINNPKANLTTASNNLLFQKNIVNGSLEEHLNSTNHTINTERHFNTSDKQGNEPVSSGDSMRDSNITTRSIKLNADSKSNTITNETESFVNCLNQTRGKYADKKDCRKFYTCVGKLQPIIGTCPNNTVFSEINKQCTRNLSHCVRNNQFRCLLEGRFGDFFLDNIYYICVKNSMNSFVRYKLQCQNGYHLNKCSIKCEKNEDIQSQSASSVSDNSKINDAESKLKIITDDVQKTNSTTDFECNSEGKFPYEKDCRMYYVCTNVKNIYRRKIKKCASDEVFDHSKKKCIENESLEC